MKSMKPINIKRVRLCICIACMILSFFLIIYFVHNPVFYVYYRAKAQTIPDYYKRKITGLIMITEKMEKEEIRGKLWELCEDPDFTSTKEISSELLKEVQELSKFTMISYIVVSFIIMIISVSLTVWYKSGEKNLMISVKEERKK